MTLLSAAGASAQDPTQLPVPLPVPQMPTIPQQPVPTQPSPTTQPEQTSPVTPAEQVPVFTPTDMLRPGVGDLTAEQLVRWAPGDLRIFGRDLFQRATTQFQAISRGPVDPDYQLGPGDQMMVVLTGDVELAHTLEVSREGTIIIPQVGQVVVQGLTVREAEDRIYEAVSRVFSGVGRGPGATTRFSASMGTLRSNQVFLAGEVERPGAYLVSSVATVFSALYQARGPNPNGSFRNVQVRRGGRLIRTVDIYEYLVRGDSRDDIRLEQGDIIFVPPAGRQVAVEGAVRRPAIYEMAPGEDLDELLRYAGGLDAAASISRIQVDRILPPAQRRRGLDRVLVDVDLEDLSRNVSVPVQDRDIVHVFSVAGERRNRVVVDGEVLNPGVYEWMPGTRLWDLIERAEGLTPTAYTPRAHIYRLNPEDGTRVLVTAPLQPDSARQPIANVLLADADSVVIYSRAELRNPRMVTIRGRVKLPGVFALAEGMTVRDLILAAGGFEVDADVAGADLIRPINTDVHRDTIAAISRVPLSGGGAAAIESSLWVPAGSDVPLVDGDVVVVRRNPGYEATRMVIVAGEVRRPGAHALTTRQTRLLDVLREAGGPTDEANTEGLRVVRAGLPVGTEYRLAVRNPRSRYNVLLEAGDSIIVPTVDPTVRVTGAVAFDSRVLYTPGRSLADYIAEAGGYVRLADRGRVSVTYADGHRATVRRSMLWRSSPDVRPGSVIFVPARPEGEPTDWGEVASRLMQGVAAAVSLWVAIDRLSQ